MAIETYPSGCVLRCRATNWVVPLPASKRRNSCLTRSKSLIAALRQFKVCCASFAANSRLERVDAIPEPI